MRNGSFVGVLVRLCRIKKLKRETDFLEEKLGITEILNGGYEQVYIHGGGNINASNECRK